MTTCEDRTYACCEANPPGVTCPGILLVDDCRCTLKLGIRNGKPAWVSDAFPGDPPPTETTKPTSGWCRWEGWADDHVFTADGNCETHNQVEVGS